MNYWKPFVISEGKSESLALLLLSAATLCFEINLTRLFSVAQFYHFAFMIVSIALLGYGASGTFLTIFSSLGASNARRSLGWCSVGASISMLGSYLLVNQLPFDSFSIAWDPKQLFILGLQYLALALPFFFSGLAVAVLLAGRPQSAGFTYGTNLLGSAMGCAMALALPLLVGGEGTALTSSALAALAALVCVSLKDFPSPYRQIAAAITLLILLLDLNGLASRELDGSYTGWFKLVLSPYKSLSYAAQYPDAHTIFSRWNAHSRVDVVRSSAIRSLPGLSFRYQQAPPRQDGLLVDGDDLSPVVLEGEDLGFSGFLPSAIAFKLRPQAQTLILEPRGGLDVLIALSQGAGQVTAVESNDLIVEAAGHIYREQGVTVVVESGRSFARRSTDLFDVVLLSLTNSYHPVRSGAYSLAEDYRYTVESFQDFIHRLKPDGLFVATRWLQTPPSESLRLFATAVTALEDMGKDPGTLIVALRGYNTATILVKSSPYSPEELRAIREFASSRAFDLIYAPDIEESETNRYNVLSESSYYLAYMGLLQSGPHQDFYRRYPYDVRPARDDRPFFGHYFKWSQASQLLSEMGRTWQPFGGAGYFVILALLALGCLFAGVLILLPVTVRNWRERRGYNHLAAQHATLELVYFSLIGFGFMLVEIPLIQKFILLLGQPAYAMTAVLFTLLLFAGIGSRLSQKVVLKSPLVLLSVLLLIAPIVLPGIIQLALGLELGWRLLVSVLILAPTGLLIGMPFSGGILWLERRTADASLISWAWGVNGAASVISSVLAALLAISIGFRWVFWIGAFCYIGACLIFMAQERSRSPRSPAR